MADKANILEGLHVLLVTEDDVRAAALTRSLRDMKAFVGDVKGGAKNPLALRGADLLVIDTRSASASKARVTELRSDVRARWASLVEIDYQKLVRDDGAILLKPLEEALAPLVTADKDLTEQARRQEKLSLKLMPLGPSRLLRALAAAGPTMQVEFKHETLTAQITLSNELLVSAFAERGANERWEAWAALVRILGLPDATISVERRSHPSAMNIMEPIDQALEVAAQERQSSAALIAVEERAAHARVEELSESMEIAVAPEKASGFKRSATAGKPAPRLDRTLMGVAPGAPPAIPPLTKPVARKSSEVSRYAVNEHSAERVKPGRTLMGIAPGALPALGAPRPRVDLSEKPVPQREPAPSEHTEVSAPMFPEGPSGPTLDLPPELAQENPTVKMQALTEAQALAHTHPANDVTERTTLNMEADELIDDSSEQTLIADSAQMRELAKQSGEGDALDALLDGPDTLRPKLAPTPAAAPVDPGAKTQLLMAVIDEAVEASPLSNPPGAKPVLHFGAAADPEDTVLIERMSAPKRSRTAFLGALLALAIIEAVVVVYVDRWQRAPEEAQRASRIGSVHVLAAPGAKPAPHKRGEAKTANTAAPISEVNAAQPANEASAAKPAQATSVAANEKPVGGDEKPVGDNKELAPVEPAQTKKPAVARDEEAKAGPEQPDSAPKPAEAAQQPSSGATEAASTVPDDLDQLIRVGLRALQSRNPSEALTLFERAVAIDARNPHAQGGLAEALLGVGRLSEAQAAIDLAIKLRPRRARYRVTQGDILKAKGDADGAETAWRKALEIDPEDRDARARLR